ncbi:hypothetical protein J057_14860 [Marinobacter nanhaiticus D15-8W]|uniref:Orn/DAP/Arg decarboxylase 2 N-terminal domain-containing protein n=1 Tax=Marinobacter nanhaiticus D15-8W TaxID=626887 RepID=N6WNU2_9GAMM|nr:alanine racemase [Marinobacter nanhaiticus]ENO12692.1 hypothetical protein J057_14860 [Marinobacter nanhaiticus D15-8W]
MVNLPPKNDTSIFYRDLIKQLILSVSSPLHAILPDNMKNNIIELQQALKKYTGLTSTLYYAMKVNRSVTLLQTAIKEGLGIDVSSENELKLALSRGADSSNCSLSGPCKSDEFIELGILAGSIIAVDSYDELLLTTNIAESTNKTARVMLRWNGGVSCSRYGMPFSDLKRISKNIKNESYIKLVGFSFHLPGYSPLDRAGCLASILELSSQLQKQGIDVEKVNIGGGIPISYISKESWNQYHANISKAKFYKNQAPKDYYPYWNSSSKERFINQVLVNHDNIERLSSLGIELILEPGRALVDNAGFSVFEVLGLKKTELGDNCIIVRGLSFSACEVWCNSEFLVDPILIPRTTNNKKRPMYAYIAGQSCLEDDLITKRLVAFERSPVRGDLLVFNNTAGYQMDLMESRFHHLPIPKKVALNCYRTDISWTVEEAM